MLLIASLVWGAAMSFQTKGMEYVGPLTFQASRFLLGGTVLVPFVMWLGKKDPGEGKEGYDPKGVYIGGAICGTVLFAACTFQQIALEYTTAAKAGFLTTLYIIIVPLFGLFTKKKPGLNIWISVFTALVGMYLLCMKDSLVLSVGDSLVVICAVIFSLQILAIDKFASGYNGLKLSCIQFFVSGILSFIAMLIFESPSFYGIIQAWVPILYTGAASCGIGYTFQTIAQKDLHPTIASLIMSMESVFAALFGWILLGQTMTAREIIGCVVMFAAVILAQMFDKKDVAGN